MTKPRPRKQRPRSLFGNRHLERAFARRNSTRQERAQTQHMKRIRLWFLVASAPKYPPVERQSHAARRKLSLSQVA